MNAIARRRFLLPPRHSFPAITARMQASQRRDTSPAVYSGGASKTRQVGETPVITRDSLPVTLPVLKREIRL